MASNGKEKKSIRMLIAVGTKVKFRHTGETGVITAMLEDGMVNVYLEEDDMEIPAFPEDLMRVETPSGRQQTARVIQVPDPLPPKAPVDLAAAPQYAILKSLGIQLGFLPQPNPDGTIQQYEVFIINDTNSPVLYACALYLKGSLQNRAHGKLEATSYASLGVLLFDQLNDMPTYEVECWRITTKGTGPRLFRNLRIKPQQFFNNVRLAPLLNQQVHWYRLFEDLESSAVPSAKKEDLRSYTKAHVKSPKDQEPIYGDWRDTLPDVQEFAEFVNEIDLHIERLTERHAKLGNSEILRIQMGHFEAFLNKANRLRIASIFVIHGVGKGVLRDAIAERLRRHPEVREFKNEYHPKYGWGATEVLFND